MCFDFYMSERSMEIIEKSGESVLGRENNQFKIC